MNSPNELFDRIGEPARLTEQSKALVLLQDYEQAHATLEHAAEIATHAGDPERARPDWSTFNLKEVQLRNECRYVEQALEDADGSVTKAAELLGLASHQSLLYMLNGRLKNRISARTPIKRRRRRILKRAGSA